jgi:hypothetical protein
LNQHSAQLPAGENRESQNRAYDSESAKLKQPIEFEKMDGKYNDSETVREKAVSGSNE